MGMGTTFRGLRPHMQGLVFWLALTSTGLAQTQGYGDFSAHMKFTRTHNELRVRDDLSANLTSTIEMLALSDTGAVSIGKLPIQFNTDLETLEIVQAHTEKSDGRILPIQPEHIDRQTGLLATGTRISWPGVEVRQITFPNVQKGDKTYVQFRKHMHKTPLPLWNSMSGLLSPQFDWDDFQLTVTAPAHLKMQVKAAHMRVVERLDGQQQVWDLQAQAQGRALEPRAVNARQRLPHWMMSSFSSFEQLGDAYAQATRDKIQITPEVKALAEQITRPFTHPEDKARAIGQWIAKNIRYVAVYLGAGGFVPHDLDWILKNRYGDCKDHVLLMMSLLQAVGIESAPALIDTQDNDQLPEVVIATFNHVLLYIPALQQFVDPTFHSIPYGKLSWKSSAKPTVVGLAQGAKILRTPTFSPSDNVVRVQSVWSIDAQGGAQVKLQAQTQGEAATTMQDRLEQIPPGLSGEAVQRILKQAQLNGSGFMQYPKVQRDAQSQSFSAEVRIDNYLRTPEAGSINPHPQMPSLPVYVMNNLGAHAGHLRRDDLWCVPIQIEEVFELHLPEQAQILFVPTGMAQQSAGLRYSSQYEL
ncbi:MAG: DUF3857 domain-containing protein, partial [Betaproteobacteria bacterium]|nr:DUF3857 domain-containing protein [Betaproteobacteria bacterium]